MGSETLDPLRVFVTIADKHVNLLIARFDHGVSR